MSDERNLLAETIEIMAAHGKQPGDVQFVRTSVASFTHKREEWCTWDEFAVLADVMYDSGFGGPEINQTLKVVGDDWWLERHEYDGSEWWEFKVLPDRPATHSPNVQVKDWER